MSGFANPFAQFGDYSSKAIQSDELVTTSYLTGLPDPKQITNDQVALIFKQLLRRDVRTKQRALTEFENWLNGQVSASQAIPDSVHLAYIQMYAKLSLDNAPGIRIQAHSLLGRLYEILGKASSKYLKYSVGPWSTARFDPDVGVVQSCQGALDRVFPGEKQQILFDRLRTPIRDYIYDACSRASAQTLSDMRYFSQEELNQKYTRLVKCCLDSMTADAKLFDLDNSEILELVESGRVWKFFSSSDATLARSAIRLAEAHVTDLEPWVGTLWKELLRSARKNASGSGVALEVLRLMNLLTKKYPTEVWDPHNKKSRGDSFASLAQFVIADPPQSARFWPLFYNLVLTVPELDSATELVPLWKPMEKVVVHQLRYNLELEESAWGCFVSLAGKMGDKYASKAFIAADQRCKGPSVPVQAIAKFLGRIAAMDGVELVVGGQLQNLDKISFEYLLILAETRKFEKLINSVVIPYKVANNHIADIGALVSADPGLEVPSLTPEDDTSTLSEESAKGWVQIAVKSEKVRSQQIVDALVGKGYISPAFILGEARGLSSRGVKVDLNKFVMDNLENAQVLCSVISAEGTEFVSHDTAIIALRQLVEAALQNEDNLIVLTRAIRDNREFVDLAVTEDSALRDELEILAADDRRGIIRSLSNLHVGSVGMEKEHRQPSMRASAHLDLENWDLAVPPENSVNPLRAPVPISKKTLEEGLIECETLAEAALGMHPTNDDFKMCATLAIVESYLRSWLLVLPAIDRQDMPMTEEFMAKSTIKDAQRSKIVEVLWTMLDSGNQAPALQYHIAQAIIRLGPLALKSTETIKYSRSFFAPNGTLKGAILAYFSAVQNEMQYDQMQRSLIKEALAGRIREEDYMLIDRSFIPESANLHLDEAVPSSTVRAINTFTTSVANLDELALQSADRTVEYAALLALPANAIDVETVLEFASSLPDSGSGMDQESGRKCLSLIQEQILSGAVDSEKLDTSSELIQNLLDRGDLIELPWICLVLPEVPSSLQFNLHTDEPVSRGAINPSVIVSWLLLMQTAPKSRPEIPENAWQHLWMWISKNLDFDISPAEILPELESNGVPPSPPATSRIALLLLYGISKQYPNTLRTWYRDIRDKSFVKQIDRLFATTITPAVMHTLKTSLDAEPPSAADKEEIEININEKQREIRATREVEDEFAVEIIISLPEQFPCKPASVNIKNLAGVSEAKKRGWLLEARHHIQDGGVVAALSSVLTRLNNFLEGVEPCAICYMTVNDLNKLPNKSCSTCHNIYHSECLYKWFTTNTNNRLCPMCRNPM